MPVIICTRRTDQGKTTGSLIEEPEELNAESREYFASQVNILSTFSSPLQSLSEQLNLVLSDLTPREEQVLRKRFGIAEKSDHTLEEVGKLFNVTRERIRQIEAKALRKLRHPTRASSLKSYYDN